MKFFLGKNLRLFIDMNSQVLELENYSANTQKKQR